MATKRVVPAEPKQTAAIYARVSTTDQKTDMQLTELRSYAKRMGWTVVEYTETMSSVRKRVVLDKLMTDARLHKFDVVLVWKLDRFARSLQQLITNIQSLDSYGVRFVCVTQGIDTDNRNPASRLMMQIFGAFAEFERSIIIERVRAGMAEAQRQGKHCGRPAPIWRRDEAVELRARGLSFREISLKLNRPETSIRRAIKAAPKG